MMQRRWLVPVVVMVTMMASACVPDVPPPVVVPVHLVCVGALGDTASSVGDSAATLALMQTLDPGTRLFDFPDATLTASVPATASGPFPVSFVLDWGSLPASGPEQTMFRELLHLSTVTVNSPALDMSAFGPGGDTMTGGPSTPVVVGTGSALAPPSVRLDHTVIPREPGTFTFPIKTGQLSVKIDSTVAGVSIGTVHLYCSPSPTAPVPPWPVTVVG